jgi:hypothetical protein
MRANYQSNVDKEVRRFTAPKRVALIMEARLLEPSHIAVFSNTNTLSAETKLEILPPVPPPPKRKRQILQALAFPFRVIGDLLTPSD